MNTEILNTSRSKPLFGSSVVFTTTDLTELMNEWAKWQGCLKDHYAIDGMYYLVVGNEYIDWYEYRKINKLFPAKPASMNFLR